EEHPSVQVIAAPHPLPVVSSISAFARPLFPAASSGMARKYQPYGEAMTVINPQHLAGRYISLSTEPEAALPPQPFHHLRAEAIQHLWAEDGAHILQPPVEIREAAAALGFDSTTLEARGHGALEARVTRSYERFIGPGQYTFRPRDDAVRLRNVVKFTWETVPTDGGEADSGGPRVARR